MVFIERFHIRMLHMTLTVETFSWSKCIQDSEGVLGGAFPAMWGSLDFSNFVHRFAEIDLQFPGHAVHEKGLQRQKGVGPLVGSQEQRALTTPRSNRGFCSFIGLHRISLVRASGGTFRRRVFDVLGSNCSVGVPARPRPAAPPCAPTRPARGMSGFWTRQVTCRPMPVCFCKPLFEAFPRWRRLTRGR